jgi:hypothetical protein
MGAVAPHLPLHRAGDFFRFAHDHSMVGFDFDTLKGYWGTQGPYYYLIARLSVRPELSVDEVVDEYASAFGDAADEIRGYLRYWENFTERAAYPVPAGGAVSQDRDGLYERAVREHGLPMHPLSGSWRVIPYLYTDDVLDRATSVLARAWRRAGADESEEARRVRFLEDGLRHLAMTREVLRLAYEASRLDGETEADFVRKVRELRSFQREITRRHVMWGDAVNATAKRRGARLAPENLDIPEGELEGM